MMKIAHTATTGRPPMIRTCQDCKTEEEITDLRLTATGCRELAVHVLIRAVYDYLRKPKVKDFTQTGGSNWTDIIYRDDWLKESVVVEDSAREFFEGDPRPLCWWAEMAGINGILIRNKVMAMKRNGEPPPNALNTFLRGE